MLTGESSPTIKTALELGDVKGESLSDVDKQHIVLAGSTCTHTRTSITEVVLAIVVRTGYFSAKGELLQSLIHLGQQQF